MTYEHSAHFNEDHFAEVDSALSANSLESVQRTLENRLATEESRNMPSQIEIDRLSEQLSYLGNLAVEASAA